MAHLNSFDSFKTKKSMMKKKQAKEKNKVLDFKDFIIDDNYNAIVVETKYDKAYVLYNDNIVSVSLRKDLNMVLNQVVFPGDKVIIENNVIVNLIKRDKVLSRIKKDQTRFNGGVDKIIATNIDVAVIVVAASTPVLHPKFIDRYLMILDNSNIEVIICLNKCDLKTDEDKLLEVYKKLGIKVIETSTTNNIGIEELKDLIRGKSSILIGNSGVGKSSITNAIMNTDSIKVGAVSDKTRRGCHTTTSSKYYIWDDNSSIIDTPGIRSLDVSNFKKEEIQTYFKEIDNVKNNCKYKDCLHDTELVKDCYVKQNIGTIITKERYDSYLRILSNIK